MNSPSNSTATNSLRIDYLEKEMREHKALVKALNSSISEMNNIQQRLLGSMAAIKWLVGAGAIGILANLFAPLLS